MNEYGCEDELGAWRDWSQPGAVACPQAPSGGAGLGGSRRPGTIGLNHPLFGMNDPYSRAGRLTTWDFAEATAQQIVAATVSRFARSLCWDQLRRGAETVFGTQTFGLGVCYGATKNPVASAAELLSFQKTLIMADVYDRLAGKVYWENSFNKGFLRASIFAPARSEVTLAEIGLRNLNSLKKAHDLREALLREMDQVIAQPFDLIVHLPGKGGDEYGAKWKRFAQLREQHGLANQFQAGELFGEMLIELVTLIAIAASVDGAILKHASQIPKLVELAGYPKSSGIAGNASERTAVSSVDSKGASGSGRVVPPLSESGVSLQKNASASKETAKTRIVKEAAPKNSRVERSPAKSSARIEAEGSNLVRGTTDIGDLSHYVWNSPRGPTMDLLLNAEVKNGTLVVSDAHIMPTTGIFDASRNALGRSGLRQLATDMGDAFGVKTIEIPNSIGRGSSGVVGSFGHVRITIVDGKVIVTRM